MNTPIDNEAKLRWIAAGGVGCFGFVAMAAIIMVAAAVFLLGNEEDVVVESELPESILIGEDVDSEQREEQDADGISRGFAISDDFVTADRYAYQIGAYANSIETVAEWPGVSFTVSVPNEIEPLPEEDHGSLWVGAILENGYFIQVGLMTSDNIDADGNMEWTYFWEMWDDEDNYLYGLQDTMSAYGWDSAKENLFTMSCQDADNGTWEFWVNDTIVGRTATESCALNYNDSYIFWELTTPKTDKAELAEFGPFELGGFEYWDDYEWLPVDSTNVSYGYGRIIDGTEFDQAAVCPPYGAEVIEEKAAVRIGSGLPCVEAGTELW